LKLVIFRSWILAASLALAGVSANAAVIKSADLDAGADSEFYSFNGVGTVGATFSDFLAISFDGTRDVAGSLSGTSTSGISFTAFNLLASDMSTVLSYGTLTSAGPRLAFGGLDSVHSFGDYFVHIAGIASGTTGYSGTLSSITPVPEPEVYGMLLAGLGLMCFVARRRKT
jgi:hypothetical protein